MLLTWHNLAYYQDLMRGLRAAIAAGGLAAHAARSARRLGRERRFHERRTRPPDPLAGLTQLGRPSPLPASPDAAVLERVANPRPAAPT